MNMKQWAVALHEEAVRKGFWKVDHAVDCAIASMHSELSEALQADRIGLPLIDIEREWAKPEGIAVELADFVMRLLDFIAESDSLDYLDIIESRREKVMANPEVFRYPCLASMIRNLHYCLVRVLESDSENDALVGIASIVFSIERYLLDNQLDLWDVIHMKHEYNLTRPALHGRKY